jgi:hypothetical protein
MDPIFQHHLEDVLIKHRKRAGTHLGPWRANLSHSLYSSPHLKDHYEGAISWIAQDEFDVKAIGDFVSLIDADQVRVEEDWLVMPPKLLPNSSLQPAFWSAENLGRSFGGRPIVGTNGKFVIFSMKPHDPNMKPDFFTDRIVKSEFKDKIVVGDLSKVSRGLIADLIYPPVQGFLQASPLNIHWAQLNSLEEEVLIKIMRQHGLEKREPVGPASRSPVLWTTFYRAEDALLEPEVYARLIFEYLSLNPNVIEISRGIDYQ